MDIGNRIRDARRAKGLSQEELSRRAGMSLKGMGDIERGDIEDPHYSSLCKIAAALDMSVAELTGEALVAGKADAPETPGPVEEGEPSSERCLNNYVRLLSVVMDRAAARWEAARSAGPVNRAIFEDVSTNRQDVLAALNELDSILEEEGLNWKDRALRGVRRTLQRSFSRWHTAGYEATLSFYESLEADEVGQKRPDLGEAAWPEEEGLKERAEKLGA